MFHIAGDQGHPRRRISAPVMGQHHPPSLLHGPSGPAGIRSVRRRRTWVQAGARDGHSDLRTDRFREQNRLARDEIADVPSCRWSSERLSAQFSGARGCSLAPPITRLRAREGARMPLVIPDLPRLSVRSVLLVFLSGLCVALVKAAIASDNPFAPTLDLVGSALFTIAGAGALFELWRRKRWRIRIAWVVVDVLDQAMRQVAIIASHSVLVFGAPDEHRRSLLGDIDEAFQLPLSATRIETVALVCVLGGPPTAGVRAPISQLNRHHTLLWLVLAAHCS